VNKRYVDGKLVVGADWKLGGNTVLTDVMMGTLNNYSFNIVRNNVPAMTFLADKTLSHKSFYLDTSNGGYMGLQSLNPNKEFGIFVGNNRHMISWKNLTAQPLRFLSSFGFNFIMGRLAILSLGNIIRSHKNIDMLNSNKIINLPAPVNATDCATKAYTDLKVSKSGDLMTGDLYFDGVSRSIVVGCTNLGIGKYFRLYSGSASIRITTFNKNVDIFAAEAITISVGTVLNIIAIDEAEIVFAKPLFMSDRKITNLALPDNASDAVNKQYVDAKYEELNARLLRLETTMT
jgi:hypothetical protein